MGGGGGGREKLQEENKEAASKRQKTRARDRSVKEKGREGQGIKGRKKKKSAIFGNQQATHAECQSHLDS